MRKERSIILASCLGNAMEFYGLTLYSSLLFQIGETFFPAGLNPVICGFLTFGVSFFIRPLGGFLCGRIGDKYGRKSIINWSVSIMGLANLIIAILPGYSMWGSTSIVILILCRLLQGFCVGIEYSGAFTFGLEHAQKHNRAYIGGWISSSCFMGFALGLIFAQCIDFLPAYGWRIGFFLSAFMTVGALILRNKIGETPEFINKEKKDCTKVSSKLVFKAFVFACADGTLTYTIGSFAFVYFSHYLGLDKQTILMMTTFFIVVTSFFCVYFAKKTTLINPVRIFKYALGVGIVLLPILFIWATSLSTIAIVTLYLTLAVLTGCFVGIQPILLYSNIPVNQRLTTSSLGYNTGLALTGGLLPVGLSWTIEQTNLLESPGLFIAVILTAILLVSRKY